MALKLPHYSTKFGFSLFLIALSDNTLIKTLPTAHSRSSEAPAATGRSGEVCGSFLPRSPLVLPAAPLSSTKQRKTSKRAHLDGDICAFFCLCLLYIPVQSSVPERRRRPPSSPRCALPPSAAPTRVKSDTLTSQTSGVKHQIKSLFQIYTKQQSGKYLQHKTESNFDLTVYIYEIISGKILAFQIMVTKLLHL